MKLNWKVVAGMLLGLCIAGGGLIAHGFDLQTTSGWGIRSSLFLFTGTLILIASLLYRENNSVGRLVNTKTGRIVLFSAVLGASIMLIYIWVISIGTWRSWPATTNYYDLLANAFSHGQLNLEAKPDPALLALADPYDPANREGVPVLWDLSLYKGEYYIYWGPVPALLLAIVKPFYGAQVPDNILTFVFMSGLLVFQILIMLELWKEYFQNTPAWAIGLSIGFVGLINPIPYMLLEPRIYEASVASGQFFFIGGLYWLFTAFNRPSTTRLALTGVFLAFAVGSRTTLVVPIAFLLIVAVIWAIRSHGEQALKFIIALALPLILGAAAYGAYNYARFNSFTEFGLGYQLTQTDIHKDLGESFSIAYAPPNLYKLLFNAFETKPAFPFIKATPWAGPAWFQGYNPKIYDYFAEDITGILVGSPFLIFAVLAALCRQQNIRWITASLAGASFLLFLTLLLFFYLTMRYLLDLLPALCLLACIGFWQGFELFRSARATKYLYTIAASGLWVYTLGISFIICYSSNLHRIRIFNPELIQKITWAFNHGYR